MPQRRGGVESGTWKQEPILTSLLPVTYRQSKRGGVVHDNWDPFPEQVIRDLCKAQADFGREKHLCGDSEWVSALKQAQENPLLPSEPFVAFVERLTSTIKLQVKYEGAQEQVLEEMALANANEQCKAAILSLSIEPAPTLHDMLQVCARKIPFITAHQNHSSRVKPPQRAPAVDTVPPAPVP
ncbi:hypothetical protein DUI87_16324 [Hirundo rustica rustica]|uniref:Retroviral nucleocapsid Gag protein p24 C-terminal domain-containing protein n=1 Tax=Hirundo rustica rustica TaxID=333673 RepID=A0A3M0K6F1_HIRRU|nr:hypothetical protein DUI87_16324 [Hirundo rustica rustica]